MSCRRLYIGCWLLLTAFLNRGQCCGPAEIGQRYTIISTAIVSPNATIVWQLGTSTILYDSIGEDTNTDPDRYVGTDTQLLVLNVTKNDGTRVFQYRVDGAVAYECSLPVYRRASTPTCEAVTLTANKIQTKCTTAQVFPQAKCQFTLYHNTVTERRIVKDGTSYITYTHTDPQPGKDEYYSTSCTLQYPVDGLKPGGWTVQVNMYPDQTGVSLAQGTTGQAAKSLPLSVPTVNIDSNNCPKGLAGEGDTNVRQGYIRQGNRASCMCTRPHAGNPPGTIDWSSREGGNFVNLSSSADVATIQINLPDGPSSVSLTFQPPGPIYLCPGQPTKIDITCQVPANNFSPDVLFTLRDGYGNNLVTKVAGDTAGHKSVNYNFTKAGQHTFTCVAENAIFSDMFSEAPTSTFQVYAPPTDPPKISARSSQHGQILVEGDDVTVTCDVSGGYPPVQSVTLICGLGQYVTSNGNSATLILNNIGFNFKETNCTCEATHVTGCYDLRSIVPFSDLSGSPKGEQGENKLLTTAQLVGVVIGSIIGTLVLVAAIALMVFFIRRDQNLRQRDPNYLTINYSSQSLDPNKASVSQESENTSRTENFSENFRPTNRESNIYNEIRERPESVYPGTETTTTNDEFGQYITPAVLVPSLYNDTIEREESACQDQNETYRNQQPGDYVEFEDTDARGYSDIEIF